MADSTTTRWDRYTPVLDAALPLRVQAVRIDYEPGGKAAGIHRHPAGAFVCVMDGAVRMGVNNQPPRTLHAGESMREEPGALHSASENASNIEPAPRACSRSSWFPMGKRQRSKRRRLTSLPGEHGLPGVPAPKQTAQKGTPHGESQLCDAE